MLHIHTRSFQLCPHSTPLAIPQDKFFYSATAYYILFICDDLVIVPLSFPLKLICPPRMRIPWILFLYHHLHHSSIQHHLHLPLLHYNTWSIIICGGCKCLSTMHSVSYYMVYYYKIVRRTGPRDSCGSCGAGSAAAALTIHLCNLPLL